MKIMLNLRKLFLVCFKMKCLFLFKLLRLLGIYSCFSFSNLRCWPKQICETEPCEGHPDLRGSCYLHSLSISIEVHFFFGFPHFSVHWFLSNSKTSPKTGPLPSDLDSKPKSPLSLLLWLRKPRYSGAFSLWMNLKFSTFQTTLAPLTAGPCAAETAGQSVTRKSSLTLGQKDPQSLGRLQKQCRGLRDD
jgi:hypothetical protein